MANLNLLRGVSGVDFRLYKPSTVRRRIARRMLLHGVQNLTEYATYLQGDPKELRDLQEDALINVTRFFRDADVFDALKTTVLPSVLEDRPSDQQVRVWVAGCSTGEEVYSIAICLLEYLSGGSVEPPIQIFGTDASEPNIQRARAGIFPDSIVDEVSPERIRRFFVKVDKGYQVSKRVRDLCIFARQNLCHDPPFSKMDLISCRNVLIYMGSQLQRQILPTFHYALRPQGVLLLGTSETIREYTDLFQLMDRRHKFFLKLEDDNGRSMLSIGPLPFLTDVAPGTTTAASESWGEIELQKAADRIVLTRYGPPGVVLNDRLEVVQFRGQTSPFLEMPPGAVSFNLTRMLRDSIAAPVTQAVRHAVENNLPVRISLQVPEGGKSRFFTLEVLPIHAVAPRSRIFLVLFVPAPEDAIPDSRYETVVPESEKGDLEKTANRLGLDLAAARLYLQTLLEERDAKNQELVSANEEIQSSNEELQSSNEELETTKEELQSSNEELQTVNEELHQRNTILTQTTNDLTNLLNSVNLPVLMLSNDFLIRHFTPPTQRLMNLRAPDIGRPFAEIRHNLNVDNLQPLLSEVLDSLTPREMEVQDREGKWYLLRVRPYRTTDNKIDGVVVVILDIDQLRRSQQELRGARDFAQSVIQGMPLPLAVVDLDLRIRAVNDAFRRLATLGKEDVDRRSLLDIAVLAWGVSKEWLAAQLEPLRAGPPTLHAVQFEYRVPGDHGRIFSISACPLQPDGEVFLLVTVEDITVHKELERLSAVEHDRLEQEAETAAKALGRTQDELRALASSLFTSQEDERRRVARELHDDIGQKLAALEIECKQTEGNIASGGGRKTEVLSNVRAALRELSDDVRRISHGLHPSAIEDLGLGPALKALVNDFREHTQMIVNFDAQDIPDLPLEVGAGLYRIAQEGLRNIRKHAGNTHVRVSLRNHGPGVRLRIVDAGDGFDMTSPRSGLGFISMEERARGMNATFTLHSKPGEGTSLTVEVPLGAAATDAAM